MDAIKNKFHQDLANLRKLIEFYDIENRLLSDWNLTQKIPEVEYLAELVNKFTDFNLEKRVFNYNSVIISLYGFFEKFIEDCLIAYVLALNELVENYNSLPELVRTSHYRLSLAILNKMDQDRYRGGYTKESVIKNLYECITLHESYQLNSEAFSQHSANFRQQVIDQSFTYIGLEKISAVLLKDSIFYNYLLHKLQKTDVSEISFDEAYFELNDLAERRNEVAHGVPSSILSSPILLDYIVYFEYYAVAMVVTLQKNLDIIHLEEYGKRLGEITDVFKNGTVVCFTTNNVEIKVGDILVGKNEHGIVKGFIKSIQIDDEFVTSIAGGDSEIGVELDAKFKKTHQLFLISSN
ncbi:MAE_28990/MAE_18760 family HEPN-like nuclease [Sediminibacterium goheungense]|uniref:RiboL-PSP-HEPN domain-containing protein n=1 Tax=Sediminibacterium goheungense TaxID=1086393 RepID=A0A4V3C553_9BACT|nr:MAE_28990/MAE_18760 family HEPN-like nuclease [Sediminibacterium goheungense]TDO28418.1 hypothetical protein BC659_0483 [Sediminibacterium goheungense]